MSFHPAPALRDQYTQAAWAARSNKNDYKAQDDFEQKQEELIKQAQGAKLDLGKSIFLCG